MDDRYLLPPDPEPVRAPNTNQLFLSLFLLVLAFFILLVTISSVEKVKSRTVMDSLTSAFTSIVPPTTDPTKFQSNEGDIVAGQQMQDTVSDLFATALQVAEVHIVQPGKLMQVKLSANSLFKDATATLNPNQFPLLDRIVAAASGRPAGLRFDMEFVIGTRTGADGALPQTQTLELARAGAFAREMVARGLPPDSIAVGLAPGDPNDVTIWFFMRSEAAVRLRLYKDAEPETPAAPAVPAAAPAAAAPAAPAPPAVPVQPVTRAPVGDVE